MSLQTTTTVYLSVAKVAPYLSNLTTTPQHITTQVTAKIN